MVALNRTCAVCRQPCLGTLCAVHDRQWMATNSYRIFIDLPQDDSRRVTLFNDFVRAVQAEERNATSPGVPEWRRPPGA